MYHIAAWSVRSSLPPDRLISSISSGPAGEASDNQSAAPMAADPRSSSAIVGVSVTGHHVLHVESYSRTKEELPTGKFISSCPFRVGGRSWSMLYYPNGHDSGNADSIAVLLRLQRDATSASDPPAAAAPVRARARFSLLDQDSKPVPSHTRTTSLNEFSVVPGRSFGFPLVRRDFLEVAASQRRLLQDQLRRHHPMELRTEDRNMSPRTQWRTQLLVKTRAKIRQSKIPYI